MQKRSWIPVAAALALTASAGYAQTRSNQGSRNGASNGTGAAANGAGQQGFSFNGTGFQFVPGTGFVPLGTTATTTPAPGAVPGTMFQFVPGSGFVQVAPGASAFFPAGSAAQQPFFYYFVPGTGFVPYGAEVVMGKNGRPLRLVRARGAAYGGTAYGSSGPAKVRNPQLSAAQADPQQQRLTLEMQDLMRRYAMAPGQFVQDSPTGVIVRYELNGETRTDTFPSDRVFFHYRKAEPSNPDASEAHATRRAALANGDVAPQTDRVILATARSNPAALQFGSKVLVPVPLSALRRTSTAAAARESRSERTRATSADSRAASGAGASSPGAGPVTPTSPAAVAPPPSMSVTIKPAPAPRVVLVPAARAPVTAVRSTSRTTTHRTVKKKSAKRPTHRRATRRRSRY